MKNLKLTNEIKKAMESDDYYTIDRFIQDAKRYIKALKSGRLLYTVTNVSKSGMSRDIDIRSFEGTMSKGSYCTYYSLLHALNFNFVSKYSNEIRVKGCGMNMLFATNYNIIHTFKNIGLISEKECTILSQLI